MVRLHSAASAAENPVQHAVAWAAQATDRQTVRDAFASLDRLQAEQLLPVALDLLALESSRPRRRALRLGGVFLAMVLAMAILLARGPYTDSFIPVLIGLLVVLAGGLLMAIPLCWLLPGRWQIVWQAALRLAARLRDPAALPALIQLAWLSRRQRDPKGARALEQALVCLLSRYDFTLHTLDSGERQRLIALAGKGGEELRIATLLTLGSLKEPGARSLAQSLLWDNSDRVRAAARECLEVLEP